MRFLNTCAYNTFQADYIMNFVTRISHKDPCINRYSRQNIIVMSALAARLYHLAVLLWGCVFSSIRWSDGDSPFIPVLPNVLSIYTALSWLIPGRELQMCDSRSSLGLMESRWVRPSRDFSGFENFVFHNRPLFLFQRQNHRLPI